VSVGLRTHIRQLARDVNADIRFVNTMDDMVAQVVPGTVNRWMLFKYDQTLHVVAEQLAKILLGSKNQPIVVFGPFIWVTDNREMWWCRYGQRFK
jgi:hypothetical protein